MGAPVLVIDDDEPIRTPLGELLENEGFQVSTARHGVEAINVLLRTKEPPAVILLDLMMPVMNGAQFLEWLRNDPRFKHTPVVIFSAWSHKWTAQPATAENVEVLTKPIDTDRLLEIVRRYCRGAAD